MYRWMFMQYPHVQCIVHAKDTCGGVNNSISFFPAEQIATTDCSDRSLFSKGSSNPQIKYWCMDWIHHNLGKLDTFISKHILEIQMISNAQVWRALSPPVAFLIAGKTFQFWLHGEKLHLPWLLPAPISVPKQTKHFVMGITYHPKTSSWLIWAGMFRVIASRRSDWQWRIVPITRWPLLHILYSRFLRSH